MPIRNGGHGYGAVSKVLHWLTVALLVTQLVVGLTMEADAAAERAETAAEAREEAADGSADAREEAARSEADEEAAEEAGERAEETAEAAADRAGDTEYLIGPADGIDLLDVHVVLGVSILMLGVARVIWRRVGGLPPWSPALSDGERRFESLLEKVLLASLFLVPGTGLTLVLSQDDALVGVHIASQVLLGLAVLGHVGLVVRHTLFRRDRLLQRMLPGR